MGYAKVKKEDLKFNTQRQRELMRVILDAFAEYDKRNSGYVLSNGASTAQLTLRAMGDFITLRAFWPKELVHHSPTEGTIYGMEDDTLHKVQSSVRSCFEQLEGRDYIERLGNEDERRWRPNKSLRGVRL